MRAPKTPYSHQAEPPPYAHWAVSFVPLGPKSRASTVVKVVQVVCARTRNDAKDAVATMTDDRHPVTASKAAPGASVTVSTCHCDE